MAGFRSTCGWLWGRREETTIGDEQLCFMPGRGTTDAIFALRQHYGETSGKKNGLLGPIWYL